MKTYSTFSIEKREVVDWVTLNRPESLNAITVEMVTELRDYFGGLCEDAEVRVVVLRGAGRGWGGRRGNHPRRHCIQL